MAAFNSTFQTDLAKPSRVVPIPDTYTRGDNESHTITVLVYDSANPSCGLMAGSVSAAVARQDGNTIPLTTGTKGAATVPVKLADGSTAQATPCTVTLKQACFDCPGQVVVVIRLVSGETITSIFVGSGKVNEGLTNSIIDPGDVITDITALIAAAEQAAEDAEEALAIATHMVRYDETQTMTSSERAIASHNVGAHKIAEVFDPTATYTQGRYVLYLGDLYRLDAASFGPGAFNYSTGGWTYINPTQEPISLAEHAYTDAEKAQARENIGAGSAEDVSDLQMTDLQLGGAISDVGHSLAADYNWQTGTYAVGDYVMYGDKLYRCATAIATPETWTPAHWTEVKLTGEVTDLKGAISEIYDVVGIAEDNMVEIDATNYLDADYKGVLGSSGDFTNTASSRYRHAIIPVTTGQNKLKITANSTLTTGQRMAFLKSFTGTSSSPDYCTGTTVIQLTKGETYEFDIPQDATYIFINLSFDSSTSFNAAPAETLIGSAGSEPNGLIQTVEINKNNLINHDMDIIPVWQSGIFTTTTGSDIRNKPTASPTRQSSNVFLFGYPVALECDNGGYQIRLTYANSNYLITETGSFGQGVFYTIPANTPFRLAVRNISDTSISDVTAATLNEHIHITALFPYSLSPVNWCAMGDSITKEYYSEMVNGSSVTGQDESRVYTGKVAKLNGWMLTNLGRGATGYLMNVDGSTTSSGWYVARHTDFTGYNLVTLAYGINDWKGNLTMGTMDDDPTAETPTTVIQAMRATIEAIMASNPACKIIVITPLNCVGYSYAYGDKSTNYGLGYSFSNTGTLEQFVAKMIEVCNYYGIQYIDQTHYSCINRENLRTALPDGVHPSPEFHDLLAHELAEKITFK